jgi:hypothetical protein
MVYKYPPWTVPFFFPFSVLPLSMAKWVWGLLEVFSLGAVVSWVFWKAVCRSGVLVSTGVAFWGLWVVHALGWSSRVDFAGSRSLELVPAGV